MKSGRKHRSLSTWIWAIIANTQMGRNIIFYDGYFCPLMYLISSFRGAIGSDFKISNSGSVGGVKNDFSNNVTTYVSVVSVKLIFHIIPS